LAPLPICRPVLRQSPEARLVGCRSANLFTAPAAAAGEELRTREGEKINERAPKNLVLAAIDLNQHKLRKKAPAGTRAKVRKSKET
jgi:hypothetical protein